MPCPACTCSLDEVRFPLRCGSWAPVAADLADPSWIQALEGAGWDPAKPTVWVAEGEHWPAATAGAGAAAGAAVGIPGRGCAPAS